MTSSPSITFPRIYDGYYAFPSFLSVDLDS